MYNGKKHGKDHGKNNGEYNDSLHWFCCYKQKDLKYPQRTVTLVSAPKNRGVLAYVRINQYLGNHFGESLGGNQYGDQTSVYCTYTVGENKKNGIKPVAKEMVSLLRYGIECCVFKFQDLRYDGRIPAVSAKNKHREGPVWEGDKQKICGF